MLIHPSPNPLLQLTSILIAPWFLLVTIQLSVIPTIALLTPLIGIFTIRPQHRTVIYTKGEPLLNELSIEALAFLGK